MPTGGFWVLNSQLLDRTKVLVSVLTFDRIEITKQYLPPLIRQISESGIDHHVVIWDNGSSDSTFAWLCQQYGGADDVYVYSHDRNVGKLAVNDVFRIVESDYFLELDDDIEAPSGFFTALVEAIQASPSETCFIGLNMDWKRFDRGFADNWKRLLDDGAGDRYWASTGDEVVLFDREQHDQYNGNLFVNGACRISRSANFVSLEHRKTYGSDVDINRQAFQQGYRNGFLMGVYGNRVVHRGPPRFYTPGVSDWENDIDA